MLNLGGWLSEKSESLYDDANYDINDGHVIKGVGKAFLSGTIDGITNGLIVNGILLTACGVIAVIGNGNKKTKEND